MKTGFFMIFIIGAIITFITKDKRFPNHPYIGWFVCMIGIAVGLYIAYIGIEMSMDNASYNAGYRDALK